MSKKIILHIGLHRTGTSSFQAVMAEHREDFLAAGIDPFLIAPNRGHARELAFACLRPGVFETPFDETATAHLKKDIADFITGSQMDRFLFSTEHLSLVRTAAEIEKLKSLFPDIDAKFLVFVVLREKEEWFRSYKDQILKEGVSRPDDSRSNRNVDDDSWVKEYEPMLRLFEEHFDEVQIIEYDKNDMTAKMLHTLGVTPHFNTQAYRRNKRSIQDRIGRIPYLILRSLFGTESHGPMKVIRRARENYLRHRG